MTKIYRMPAEWEEHEGTWIAWPHNISHWPGKFEPIPHVYAKIVKALIEGDEKVFICVNDEKMESAAHALIKKEIGAANPRAQFFQIPTDASWSRDHGPIFVRDPAGQLIVTDWIFNAWGAKYKPWDKDDAVPQKIAQILHKPLVAPGIVLEGGSIDVNGRGSLLATEQCLLNKNRNPHLNRGQIEKYLHDYLGVVNVLWLKEGIIGDDTDGHIDDIARFIDEKTIVCAVAKNPSDENYEILKRNYEDLKRMRNEKGNAFNIVEIPMPDPVIYENQKLPASYINFYIANSAVLVPTFQCKRDRQTLGIFSDLFPTRKIIPVDCVDLIWGLGTIHCLTQQQPR